MLGVGWERQERKRGKGKSGNEVGKDKTRGGDMG